MDEHESLWEIVDNIKGLLFADKGLFGTDFQRQLYVETGVNLQTPIGQPTEGFNIEKNWA